MNEIMIDKLMGVLMMVFVFLMYLKFKAYKIEKELGLAVIRAMIQLFAIAFFLGMIISINHPLYTISVLSFMIAFAAYIARRRVIQVPGLYKPAVIGIFSGSVIILTYSVLMNIFPLEARFIIPFGSMVIANAMNSTALALNRFIGEIKAHRYRIESKLSLGVPITIACKPHVRDSVRASLIPAISTLESLGLVWIPGTMSGMILGGADPIWAAQYQLFVSFSIMVGDALASIMAIYLATHVIFTRNHTFNEKIPIF